jgi:cytochrome P450
MSTLNMAATPGQGLPGPWIPAWTQTLTNLLPWRLELDPLNYLLKSADRYGNFYAIWVADKPIYVVSDPALVREILVERAAEFHRADLLKRSLGHFLRNGLFISEGDLWRRQRKLAQPAFYHDRMAAYGATMVQQTQELLATWQAGETRNIATEMTKLTLGVVTKTLFSVDVQAQAEHIGQLMMPILAGASDRLYGYDPVWDHLLKHKQRRETEAIQELFHLIEKIIAEHRRHAEDSGDLLSMWLAARDDEGRPMSKKQLRDQMITFLISGYDTTATALAWLFYLVAQHSRVAKRLGQELAPFQGQPLSVRDLAQAPYSEQVVKEAMRLYPPAGGVMRQPLHDLELGGYLISKGSSIAISVYAMHHDPKLYPDPERFDPDRFCPENEAALPRYAYLPFGAGPRVCIGNSFAMMEARLILLTVLQHWKLALAPGQTVRAEQLFNLRPKGGLWMIVQKREASRRHSIASRLPSAR